MSYLLDPKFFNYLIMTLYLINSARWAIECNWGQFVYWIAAFALTFSISFMMGK